MLDRKEFLATFRSRLGQVLASSGLSRTAFADRVAVDRSTLSQLLSPGNRRLPRLETLAAIATSEQVSLDWLVGLSQEGPVRTSILREEIAIERSAHSPFDERLLAWHADAIGYKIRYIPSTLPDLMKIEEVIRLELGHAAARTTPEQTMNLATERLAWQRRPETDMECLNSTQAIEGFARGETIWRNLDQSIRIAQLEHMTGLVEELYPTFRWFGYDGLYRYGPPVTIFGPKRACLYVGQMYAVFTGTEAIRALIENFDDLIRAATVQPREMPEFLRDCTRLAKRQPR